MAWLRREDLEDLELRDLNRWAARSRAHGGRRRDEPDDVMRTAFQRDRDRLIHSASFRRLQHKTQVLAAYEGDHYRSRMTHSIEVSQMARGVATALRLNHDLAEAVALAHDLGHPPFGHVGEETLDELMAGHGGFRHNAQGLRVVDYLENRYGHGDGLNLVLAVRRSLLKGKIPEGFPLSPDLLPRRPPPLEAEVVDRCDRIAYLCHDLDDGLRAGAFSAEEPASLELWRLAAAAARSDRPARVISEMIALMIQDLVLAAAGALEGAERPRLRHGERMSVLCQELLAFLRERFYRSEMVLRKMDRGRAKIRELFEELVAHPERLPAGARARLSRDGLERAVCDHVAGMTDRYLLKH